MFKITIKHNTMSRVILTRFTPKQMYSQKKLKIYVKAIMSHVSVMMVGVHLNLYKNSLKLYCIAPKNQQGKKKPC